MPFIGTKVNVELTREREEAIKAKLGKAIAIIPGKSESWLMCSFEDNCRLYFRGKNDEPTAFVEVKVFGGLSAAVCERLTSAITEILNTELGVAPGHIYIKYEEVENWGWNGANL